MYLNEMCLSTNKYIDFSDPVTCRDTIMCSICGTKHFAGLLQVWKFPKGYTMEDVLDSSGIETVEGGVDRPSVSYK